MYHSSISTSCNIQVESLKRRDDVFLASLLLILAEDPPHQVFFNMLEAWLRSGLTISY